MGQAASLAQIFFISLSPSFPVKGMEHRLLRWSYIQMLADEIDERYSISKSRIKS